MLRVDSGFALNTGKWLPGYTFSEPLRPYSSAIAPSEPQIPTSKPNYIGECMDMYFKLDLM